MSPAPARTSRAAILAASRTLLEDGGLDAVSMAAVAGRVGIRPPSLYKHFADRSDLLAAVATAVARDLGRTLVAAAGLAGPEPRACVHALATAYRTFALSAPRATALLFSSVAPGAEPSAEAQAEAARPVLEVATALVGPTAALAAARALTAFTHGFTSMESAGAFRFGGDVDEAYGLGIDALVGGLERQAEAGVELRAPSAR